MSDKEPSETEEQESINKKENKNDKNKMLFQKVTEQGNTVTKLVDLLNQFETEKEFGDVLFSLVNYSRFIKTDPEAALEKTNIKFKKRFERMEQMAVAQNKSLQEMTLMEMDALWNETKKEIR